MFYHLIYDIIYVIINNMTIIHVYIYKLINIIILLFILDAIASADNVRIAPSLKSQKGLFVI